MNIVLSALVAIIAIFALKQNNQKQNNGIGNYRFLLGFICGIFPYVDRLFPILGESAALSMVNSITWSVILLPVYAGFITYVFHKFIQAKCDIKFLLPNTAGTLLAVYLFNLLGNHGVALFFPLLNEKIALNILYDFNLHLFLILLTAIVLLIALPNHRRDVARSFLAIIGVFIISVFSISLKARTFAKQYAISLNVKPQQIYTLAQPLSIFNWRIMIFDDQGKIHDSFFTLKENVDSEKHYEDHRTQKVASLYKPAEQATWRIYRKTSPHYQAQYDRIVKKYDKDMIFKDFMTFAILKGKTTYKNMNCLQFKDLRKEGVRKTLKGNMLFCKDPNRKKPRIFNGQDKHYQEI